MTVPSGNGRLAELARQRLPIWLAGALGVSLVLFTLWVFATQKRSDDTDRVPRRRSTPHARP